MSFSLWYIKNKTSGLQLRPQIQISKSVSQPEIKVWQFIMKFNYNPFSLLNFQNPTSGLKVMIAVNQLLNQLKTAVKQLLQNV